MARDPIIALRLPKAERGRLRAVAKIYGAPSTSAFVRDMLRAILSGTPEGPAPFLQRLGMALGQQQQLDLFAQARTEARKQAQEPRSARKRGKGAAPP